MLTTGFSRLRSWRRCRRLHNYRYRQFLTRLRPKVPLIRGTILHELLNARAKGENPKAVLIKYEKEYGKLFREEREEYGDMIGDCANIFRRYCEAYDRDGLTVIASEHEIRIVLIESTTRFPGLEFKGTIDRVLLDKQAKRRWISDSKSHKNIPGEEARFNDLQTVFYVWAWNVQNPRRPVDGVIWDYLRTKLPTLPEVLKSGKLSQRSNIDTTHGEAARVVAEHCKQTGEDPLDYHEWLEGLRGREEKFFRRVFLPSPPRIMVDTIVREMQTTGEQMIRELDDDTRTLTKDCSFCEFRELCHAELRGQDAEFIRKSEFRIDQEIQEEYAEED